MRTSEPMPGVLHILFDTRLSLTLSMCRMQEYYESPLPELRGKVFSMADFIAAQAKPDGSIDYFSYWDGFNVPKQIVDDFFALFTITRFEHDVACAWDLHGYKYLIASEVGSESSTLPHELAHARYALDPVYQVQVNKVVRAIPLPVAQRMRQDLSARYANMVMEDEINAYLLTGDSEELKEVMPSIGFDDWYPWHLQLRSL